MKRIMIIICTLIIISQSTFADRSDKYLSEPFETKWLTLTDNQRESYVQGYLDACRAVLWQLKQGGSFVFYEDHTDRIFYPDMSAKELIDVLTAYYEDTIDVPNTEIYTVNILQFLLGQQVYRPEGLTPFWN